MPQVSSAIDALPAAATAALRKLGADLLTARKRRKQSLRAWALRLGVSVPTLMRMEKGDAAVSIGVYATALWMMGRHEALAVAAEPKEDMAALENDVNEAAQWHRRDTAASL
ncbi:MAG: XRE family transcriptional regulator [Pseudomonadota bacterium]